MIGTVLWDAERVAGRNLAFCPVSAKGSGKAKKTPPA